MKIINVETPRGLVLKGVLQGETNMSDTVVIMFTGICSNVFQNELLVSTGEFLNKNNIAYICAHAMDSFSCIAYSDHSINKQRYTGTVFDDFSIVYEDVDSYIQYAKSLGFKNIILAGHSLGSNKIIHYLSKTAEPAVKNFIVSAPIDLMYFWDSIEEKDLYLKTARSFVDDGRGRDILPFLFMGFSPMCAQTVLDFYNAENLKNCPVISNEGETDSLKNIKIHGAFVIGEKDSMTGGDAFGFIEKINSFCAEPQKNKLFMIENASHIFYGKHNEYAQVVLDYVKECIKDH